MASANKIYYGSGEVFAIEFDESAFPSGETADDVATTVAYIQSMLTEDNRIGYLKDGYELTVETDNFEDESDLGEMKVSEITKETATISFKLFNANGQTIANMYPTASYVEDGTDGYTMTVAGGLTNLNSAKYALLFKHDDTQYGQTLVLAVGKNISGFTLTFKQGSVEPFGMEWSVQPYADSGRFVKIIDVPVGTTLSVS